MAEVERAKGTATVLSPRGSTSLVNVSYLLVVITSSHGSSLVGHLDARGSLAFVFSQGLVGLHPGFSENKSWGRILIGLAWVKGRFCTNQ